MNQEQTERERLIRTEMLLGEAAMERLRQAHVAVFGIASEDMPWKRWRAAGLAR